MVFHGKVGLFVLGAAFLFNGCVSNSQTYIGPSGDVKNCASTSTNQGLIAVALANSRFNSCKEGMEALNYKEIENIGTIGISLSQASADGFKVLSVYDNSPAAKAGILRGDKLVAINGTKIMQSRDFALSYGDIGTSVEVTIERKDKLTKYSLARAKSSYSKILEDVTY